MKKSDFNYKPKTEKQLKNWFKQKIRENKQEFKSEKDFLEWYKNQPKKCYYCNLTEVESQKIVITGLLKSNRFPIRGEIKQGKNRGVWLEIDRKKPKEKYSKGNCVLACYFCNNDKSDVFESAEEYKKFQNNRIKYLKELIKRH